MQFFLNLRNYFFLNYIALFCQTFIFFKMAEQPDFLTTFFCIAVYITYPVIYLAVIFIPVLLLSWILGKGLRRFSALRFVIYTITIVGCTLIQIVLITDIYIFKIFGFHFNGFILNMLLTKGGIQALGSEDSTYMSVALISSGFLLFQTLLFLSVACIQKIQTFFQKLFVKKVSIAMVSIFLSLAIFERVNYAVCSVKAYMPVLEASNAFPFYIPFHMNKALKKLGLKAKEGRHFKIKIGDVNLCYPLKPIERKENPKNYNIVWLVGESLRTDVLEASIMPETWKFAQKSLFFQNHYSGGNSTRTGVFTLFYGLHGTYWFPFFHAKRSPVLLDFLQKEGYHIEIFSSQSFTFPEFDKTVFVNMPPAQMHLSKLTPGWRRDREHVDSILEFLSHHDRQKPFMLFMFYDSTHSSYSFPPECTIREPYILDFNYVTTDLKKDMELLKNSYINAVYHLDTQVARVLNHLEKNNFLEDTIIIITGDHGQEFMEKGRWGHHSSFSEEQTKTPLVLWVPGQKHQTIQDITCHQDIAPTILSILGAKNSPEDYSLGNNLLDFQKEDFVILSDWTQWCYVDYEYKGIFPMDSKEFWQQKVTTLNDQKVSSSREFYEKNQTRLVRIMKDLTKFTTFSKNKD